MVLVAGGADDESRGDGSLDDDDEDCEEEEEEEEPLREGEGGGGATPRYASGRLVRVMYLGDLPAPGSLSSVFHVRDELIIDSMCHMSSVFVCVFVCMLPCVCVYNDCKSIVYRNEVHKHCDRSILTLRKLLKMIHACMVTWTMRCDGRCKMFSENMFSLQSFHGPQILGTGYKSDISGLEHSIGCAE